MRDLEQYLARFSRRELFAQDNAVAVLRSLHLRRNRAPQNRLALPLAPHGSQGRTGDISDAEVA